MKTVAFGKRERFRFTSGGSLLQWKPIQGPAIYALTYKQDPEKRPKSHTVVYFGEALDLSQPAVHKELMQWWEQNSDNRGDLFFFFHPMPGSSQYERISLRNQLAREYEPQGNE